MKSKVSLVLCVLVFGLTAQAMPAAAQSFRLNTLRAAERPDDGFAVRRLGALDHLRWGAMVTADYAHDPLVIAQRGGRGAELARVVGHQLTLKLDLSLSLWRRLLVFAGLEAVPVMHGPRVRDEFMLPRTDGGGLGDLALGARVRIVGDETDLFALGAQATLLAPTAGDQTYRGEEGVAFRPELIAELRPKPVRITFNAGTHVRKPQRLLESRLSSQLTYAAALALPLPARFELLGELWGSFAFHDFGRKTTSPIEWLLGGKYRSAVGLYAGVAAGRGFSHGIGAPDARVVAQLGYLSRRPAAQPAAPARPPPPPPPPPMPAQPTDRDGDTIVDESDRCPDQPEDLDDFEDADGCVDGDDDRDGLADLEDACPKIAGVVEERGCPAKLQLSEQGELVIAQQVLFETNASVLLNESLPNLEAVQVMLAEHPEITKLRIEGHTDSSGQDQKNLVLSQRRAAAVMAWLVGRGVDPARLTAYGCGEQHPIASDATPAGQAENRRVTFQVVEPAPSDASRAAPPAGCLSAPLEGDVPAKESAPEASAR